jgi:hypothetical protein
MNRYYAGFGAGAVCLLAGLAAFSWTAPAAVCPAVKVSYFGIEPHEGDVRWIVSKGVPCRLRFAFSAASVPLADIRYQVDHPPKIGRTGIDELGVVLDLVPNSEAVTFSLTAILPGAPPVRSVFKVSSSDTPAPPRLALTP